MRLRMRQRVFLESKNFLRAESRLKSEREERRKIQVEDERGHGEV